MYYQEHHPDKRLTFFIETYWMAGGFMEGEESSRILPDGCVDIIFTFDEEKNVLRSDIVGTMTTFLEINYSKHVKIWGIRFNPAGITAFTRVPIEEFTNQNIELSAVETLFDPLFYEIGFAKKSPEEIVQHIDTYLLHQLPYLYNPDMRIIRAVDLIHHSKGCLSLTDVASEVCLSQRHFERKFKSAIGINPKTFAKIIRFKHTLPYLRNYPYKDLLSIAIECGYYDHAHLIKDMKTLSGNTPTNFRL